MVQQIAGSIAEFGFVNPVLVGGDNIIIAGYSCVMASKWRSAGRGIMSAMRR